MIVLIAGMGGGIGSAVLTILATMSSYSKLMITGFVMGTTIVFKASSAISSTNLNASLKVSIFAVKNVGEGAQ